MRRSRCGRGSSALGRAAARRSGSPSRTVVLDRDGRLLRALCDTPTAAGGCRRRRTMSIRASRPAARLRGQALLRSITASIRSRCCAPRCSSSRNGRIVSGGSTLTMQVARLLEPRASARFGAKLRQIGARDRARARARARTRSSRSISTLAPYGGNLEGVRAASLAYFGKEPRRLTLAEAALLVALPQSPEQRRPDRSPQAARRGARPRARSRRARRAHRRATRSRAPRPSRCRRRAGRCRCSRRMPPTQACRGEPDARVHRLTIDAPLQTALEDARARARARARAGHFGRDPRRRQCDRRGARARRLGAIISTRAAPARST